MAIVRNIVMINTIVLHMYFILNSSLNQLWLKLVHLNKYIFRRCHKYILVFKDAP